MQTSINHSVMGSVRCPPCAQQRAARCTQPREVIARSAAAPRVNVAAVLEDVGALNRRLLEPSVLDQPAQTIGTVTELCVENFAAFMEESAAAGVPVVVDFFTTWCGPCKFIAPELVKMSAEIPGVRFAKFDCGSNDKKFVKEMGIKALPTFHMYKDGVKVDQFVGAKARELRRFVERHLATPKGL